MIQIVAIFAALISAEVIISVECADPTVIIINSLADRGLDKLVRKLRSKDIETLAIPDIDYTIKKKLPHVRLELKQGTFGNFYTWKRVGDVSLIMDGNALTVNLTTTFDNAVFHFRDMKATVGRMDLTDELTIFVKKNQINLQATLLLTEGGFKVNVDELKLTEFGDFHVERRKKGELQSDTSNEILTTVFNSYSEKLRELLSGFLKTLVQNKLKDYDLIE